ncbi:MSC_0623 family F1-like ATPase-associated protein [Mycoplasma hafezii]|uniref:MSC_0623 family F1-like ATPase-associated protein n=1 Tax=Mycoplasma hafezii TaxID=525886 RepID=UPI003CEED6D3
MSKLWKKTKKQDTPNQLNEYQQMVFANYENARTAQNFLEHQAFINQFLLVNNLRQKDTNWVTLKNKAEEYLAQRNELIFDDFVLTFTRDPRFSLEELVPDLVKEPNAKLLSLSFNNSNNEAEAKLLNAFNNLLFKLLKEEQKAVELFDGIIISFDSVSNKYTILFSQELIQNAHSENKK